MLQYLKNLPTGYLTSNTVHGNDNSEKAPHQHGSCLSSHNVTLVVLKGHGWIRKSMEELYQHPCAVTIRMAVSHNLPLCPTICFISPSICPKMPAYFLPPVTNHRWDVLHESFLSQRAPWLDKAWTNNNLGTKTVQRYVKEEREAMMP